MQMAITPFPLCKQLPRCVRLERLSSVILSKKTDRFSRWMQSLALPGQWYDKDTESRDSSGVLLARGLHYNWHRFYDPEVGRYISVDPLGLDAGLNVFGYAFGNPTTFVDPDGQSPGVALKILVTAIIGLALYIFSDKGCGTNKDGKNMADKATADKAIDKTKKSKKLLNDKHKEQIKVLCKEADTNEAQINCLASIGNCTLLKYKYKQLQADTLNYQLYSDERLEGLLISCERAAEKFRPSYPFKKWKKRW